MNAPANLPAERKSILATMASRYSMEPNTFEATLRATVVPKDCTREQFAACLVVANEYRLNPLTKEIYFFPARGGGIVPVVGVDGWCRIINEHPGFDGMEFDTAFAENGKPISVTCRMFRKDRARPITITEFYNECFRQTDPWKQAPARMLRHKAMIQGARYSFGFAGIYDPDEAERIAADGARDVTPSSDVIPPRPPIPPTLPQIERQVASIAGEIRETSFAEVKPPMPPRPPVPVKPPVPNAKAAPLDPEALRARFSAAARAAKDVEQLHDAWEKIVEPAKQAGEVFPPDEEDLLGIFRARERDFEP